MKVGDIVFPTVGPHASEQHKIIFIHDDGRINIQLTGYRNPKFIRYHHGALTVYPNQVEKI